MLTFIISLVVTLSILYMIFQSKISKKIFLCFAIALVVSSITSTVVNVNRQDSLPLRVAVSETHELDAFYLYRDFSEFYQYNEIDGMIHQDLNSCFIVHYLCQEDGGVKVKLKNSGFKILEGRDGVNIVFADAKKMQAKKKEEHVIGDIWSHTASYPAQKKYWEIIIPLTN